MIKDNPESRKRRKHTDRITLTDSSLRKLSHWITLANQEVRGAKINRTEFVNWMISELPETLNSNQLKKLHDEFFDEVKHFEWVLAEVKKAKQKGDSVQIESLLSTSSPRKKPTKTPLKKRSSKTDSITKNEIFSGKTSPEERDEKSPNQSKFGSGS